MEYFLYTIFISMIQVANKSPTVTHIKKFEVKSIITLNRKYYGAEILAFKNQKKM